MSKDDSLKDLIIVRYADHVVYIRCSALTMKPQIRQAVGWLIYECEQIPSLLGIRHSYRPPLKGSDQKRQVLCI